MKMIPASAVMITKNAERYLVQVLTALAPFEEVVLLDNGSTDGTLTIAQNFTNVKIYEHAFIGFGPLKNLAAEKASYDWVFSIDSDEVPDDALLTAVAKVVMDNPSNVVGEVLRLNHFRGRLIKACGWYPDVLPRLYRKSQTRLSNRQVHEGVEIPNGFSRFRLDGHLKHYSFASVAELLAKMQHYTTLFAEENQGKRTASLGKAILHGMSAFIKSYVIKKGFFYGADGFIISRMNAQISYYKYVKLMEYNNKLKDNTPISKW